MAGFPPKKNTAFTFYTALVSQADTDIFKTSPTLAAGDIKVSIDGATFDNIATLPTQLASSGVLPVALTAAEMNGDVIIIKFVDASGAEWQDQLVTIMTDTKLVSDAVTLAATQGAITWAKQIITTDGEGDYALNLIGSSAARGLYIKGSDIGAYLEADTPITPVLATPTNITAGTITTATSVTNPVDVGSISGDSTAANNLELQYDGTGLTGVTFPASQAQVSAVMTTAQTESYAADGAAATPAQMLYMILQLLGEKTVVGTTLTVKKLDGSATAMTFTLNDGTSPTSITRAT